MTKFLKGLIPNIFLLTAFLLDELSKVFAKVGFNLHVAFNTDTGKKIKEMKKAAKELNDMMAKIDDVVKRAEANATPQEKALAKKKVQQTMGKMNPKLYKIIKGDGGES